jgi:hypothetical protein
MIDTIDYVSAGIIAVIHTIIDGISFVVKMIISSPFYFICIICNKFKVL